LKESTKDALPELIVIVYGLVKELETDNQSEKLNGPAVDLPPAVDKNFVGSI
jgi:hypothetical protein